MRTRFRWTRERWYKATHLARRYRRDEFAYCRWDSMPKAATRLEELLAAHPGMTGEDPLTVPIRRRYWERLERDEVPF